MTSDPSQDQEALALLTTARTHLARIRTLAETGNARDEHDPDDLNTAFRAVHSLAGVLQSEVKFSGHVLCNRLDDMRMGKLPLSATNLDQVIAGVELLARKLETPDAVEAAAFAKMERELAELGQQARSS